MATSVSDRTSSFPAARTSAEPLEPRVLLSTISFEPLVKYPAGQVSGPTPVGAHLVAVGDFNGDGIQDLVAAGDMLSPLTWEMHYVRVLLGKGDGTFSAPVEPKPAGDQISDIAVADFDADGRLDVAVANRFERGAVHVLRGNGDGTFGIALGRSVFSGARSSGLAVGDFNRDGAPDLVVSNAEPWTPEFSLAPAIHGAAVLLNKGDGTFDTARLLPTRGPQHFVETGDVNNDRLADAVFGQVVIGPGDFAAPESRVFAMLGGGRELLSGPGDVTKVPAAITGMELADLNGDGRLDVALSTMTDFMRPGGGGAAGVVPGNGDGNFGEAALYPVGLPVTSDVAVADFDADGRPDLAVSGHNPMIMAPFDRGHVVALHNLGGRFGEPVTSSFMGHPAGLAAGQFNRDRLPDLATAIPREDALGVLLNNTRTISARSLPVNAVAGTALTDQAVARFTMTGTFGSAPAAAADGMTATILWGDGTARTAGKIVANDDGTFSVLGTHTYRRRGLYRVVVLIRSADGTLSRAVATLARVRAPALVVS